MGGGKLGDGKEFGGMVKDVSDASFEFEIVPEEKIGFFGSDSVGLSHIFQKLLADKPGEWSDKKQRYKGDER